MAIEGTYIQKEIDAVFRAVVQNFVPENKVFEAFVFEKNMTARPYGIDKLVPIGVNDFSVLGANTGDIALGTSARETTTFTPTKIGKSVIVSVDDWTAISQSAKENLVKTHIQGLMNICKRLLTTGQALYLNEKGDKIVAKILKNLTNLGVNTSATANAGTDVSVFLSDLEAAKKRITTISTDLKPDTLYISDSVWTSLIIKSATSSTNQELEAIVKAMGFNVITDSSLDSLASLGSVFSIYKKDINVVTGKSQSSPNTTLDDDRQDTLDYFMRMFVGGLHNIVVPGAVQTVVGLS